MARKYHATVKVMGGGRITIPSEIRKVENIKEGSYLEISIEKIEDADASKNLKANRKPRAKNNGI